MEALLPFILSLVQKYPLFASVLLIMGSLRAIFKPLLAVARAYVGSTPSKSDDEALNKVEASKLYKTVAFILDYVASIKLTK